MICVKAFTKLHRPKQWINILAKEDGLQNRIERNKQSNHFKNIVVYWHVSCTCRNHPATGMTTSVREDGWIQDGAARRCGGDSAVHADYLSTLYPSSDLDMYQANRRSHIYIHFSFIYTLLSYSTLRLTLYHLISCLQTNIAKGLVQNKELTDKLYFVCICLDTSQ